MPLTSESTAVAESNDHRTNRHFLTMLTDSVSISTIAARLRNCTWAIVGLALVASAGCVQSRTSASTPVQPLPDGQASAAAIAEARADSIRRPYTAADIHFMSAMIGHHSQAIVMARMVPTHEASPAVRRLAERIISSQEDEIGTMRRWLADRRQTMPETSSAGVKMKMNGMDHFMLMPGMINESQMKRLDAARGHDFDRLFLSYMIQHHRGAVSMVTELFASYGAGEDETVFKFASDVNVDQTTEIARMEKLLASLTLGIPFP